MEKGVLAYLLLCYFLGHVLDSSPRSSPRTPQDSKISSPHNKVFSSRSQIINESSRDSSISVSKMTFSSDNENYSTIGASSTEPSFEVEEDDKYSVVDNTLISSILLHNSSCTTQKQQELEEDEKYSTVDDDLKHSLGVDDFHHKLPPLPPPPPPPEDEEPSANYDEIKSLRVNNITTHSTAVNEVEEFPDYAVVDLSLKQKYRAKMKSEQKQDEEPKIDVEGIYNLKQYMFFFL